MTNDDLLAKLIDQLIDKAIYLGWEKTSSYTASASTTHYKQARSIDNRPCEIPYQMYIELEQGTEAFYGHFYLYVLDENKNILFQKDFERNNRHYAKVTELHGRIQERIKKQENKKETNILESLIYSLETRKKSITSTI